MCSGQYSSILGLRQCRHSRTRIRFLRRASVTHPERSSGKRRLIVGGNANAAERPGSIHTHIIAESCARVFGMDMDGVGAR